jgi:predicted component of type VI protein secretion system
MKPTMTFSEFTSGEAASENAMVAMMAAKELKKQQPKKNEGSSCMSESTVEKCNEMREAMCAEMDACHADETERTAESYMKEASAKLNEMLEGLSENAMVAMMAAKELKKKQAAQKNK